MSSSKQKNSPIQHLIAGGAAGFMESSICHPLDTIKTRMQLRRQSNTIEAVRARSSLAEPSALLRSSLAEPIQALHRTAAKTAAAATATATTTTTAAAAAGGVAGEVLTTQLHEPALRMTTTHAGGGGGIKIAPPKAAAAGAVTATLGPIGTASRIIRREGFFALYKGLTAVYTGIIPKMAIRFVSFEYYRDNLHTLVGGGGKTISSQVTFTAGLFSGLTEAIMVVTPAEVCKIRMQSQYNSMMDPSQMRHRKYTNVVQTAITIAREEGITALYKGVVPTMVRQGCNQAVNFTMYQFLKRKVLERTEKAELVSWQSLVLGGFSGAFGPMANNPLDVVKTRMQKQVIVPGKKPKYSGLVSSCVIIAKDEGFLALWKGISARLLRIVPGQAITFMTYEAVSSRMRTWQ